MATVIALGGSRTWAFVAMSSGAYDSELITL